MNVVLYPALEFRSPDFDLIYAALDDFSPTAIEEDAGCLRAFFASSAGRDAAFRALGDRFAATPVDVPDEDWARRSQENLPPITVGRITIYTSATSRRERHLANHPPTSNPDARIPNPDATPLVIVPSMGFGTGHHATTRLCLAALQDIDLQGRSVLDVGTGSGVLAIAARLLGAAAATGIDIDPDAVQAARDNLRHNPDATRVEFACLDLVDLRGEPVDVVTANLTGALLIRSAAALLDRARPGGILILSGVLADERDAVAAAFAGATILRTSQEGEWVGLTVKKS